MQPPLHGVAFSDHALIPAFASFVGCNIKVGEQAEV
jgi:hypothetical protein